MFQKILIQMFRVVCQCSFTELECPNPPQNWSVPTNVNKVQLRNNKWRMLHDGDGVKGAVGLSGISRGYPKGHDNSGTPQNLRAGLRKPTASQNTTLNLG